MSQCLFCRIVSGSIPAKVVADESSVLAFKDINPQAPVHILVIPKKHVAKIADLGPDDFPVLSEIQRVIQRLAKDLNVQDTGFRLVVNNGPDAGQEVDHLHYHFLAGRKLSWPPG